jgi:hypothetical protein
MFARRQIRCGPPKARREDLPGPQSFSGIFKTEENTGSDE